MQRSMKSASVLRGDITVPGDKSISHRAVMIGAIANGITEITGFLNAADPVSTINCMRALGVEITVNKHNIAIRGKGLTSLTKPISTLDAGNSGTTIRLLSGILAGQKFASQISGDRYLLKRPMKRVVEPLRLMGANVYASVEGTPPLEFSPSDRLHGIRYELPIPSAQVKSAILLAGLFANGITQVVEMIPSRDHTERMLGLTWEEERCGRVISVEGGTERVAVPFAVPGDPSSAAFFIVAVLISRNAEIVVRSVGLNATRTGFLDVLRSMGGNITIENERVVGGERIGDIVAKSSSLKNRGQISGGIIANIIDEIPILAVAGAFADGIFEVRGARDLRAKECDRIAAICHNLRVLGITVEEYDDGFAFEPKNIASSAVFESFGDHRIAMAFGVAALALTKESAMNDADCVDISFPPFWKLMYSLIQ